MCNTSLIIYFALFFMFLIPTGHPQTTIHTQVSGTLYTNTCSAVQAGLQQDRLCHWLPDYGQRKRIWSVRMEKITAITIQTGALSQKLPPKAPRGETFPQLQLWFAFLLAAVNLSHLPSLLWQLCSIWFTQQKVHPLKMSDSRFCHSHRLDCHHHYVLSDYPNTHCHHPWGKQLVTPHDSTPSPWQSLGVCGFANYRCFT
jgi:hypothetical protein